MVCPRAGGRPAKSWPSQCPQTVITTVEPRAAGYHPSDWETVPVLMIIRPGTIRATVTPTHRSSEPQEPPGGRV
eukprot:276255-Hanusia_phi.AAC.1